VFFRQKAKLTAPSGVTGLFSLSAWMDRCNRFFFGNPTQGQESYVSLFEANSNVHGSRLLQASGGARPLERDFGKQECAAELNGLFDELIVVRKRILANTFLYGWTKWFAGILIALIVIAAIVTKLAWVLILAGILVVVGAGLIFARSWRVRPPVYDAARRLDSVAGLQDRVSTAVFLGTIANPDEITRCQRQDAIARGKKVDPRLLFPISIPMTWVRALAIVLLTAGLLVYRINHRPPLTALLQSARLQLAHSALAPIVHSMEKDLQRTLALVTSKADTLADNVRPGEALEKGDALWQHDDQKADKDDTQKGLEAADQPQDPSQQGDQNNSQADQAQPQDNSGDQASQGQQKEGKDSNNSSSDSANQSMKNPTPSQNQDNRPNEQQGGKNSPKQGNSQQAGASQNDRKNDSQGKSDAQQQPTKNAASGAGNQKGMKDIPANLTSHPVIPVPDRVALEANGFKEKKRSHIVTETGTAQLSVRDVSPQGEAVINGTEQENIPARYRLYVQRYFEHAGNN
jgi:hypothetical protein